MSLALYLIVEGVTDASLVGRLLVRRFGATDIKDPADLDPALRAWVLGYKWPYNNDISRGAVPVPKLLRLGDGRVVAIANGTGVEQMKRVATQDQINLDLRQVRPSAVAAIVDSDGKDPATRAALAGDVLRPFLAQAPAGFASGAVLAGAPRCGTLVVPEAPGITIDSVLDALGKQVYPDLHAEADALVQRWVPKALGPTFKDLRSPAGPTKARLGVMGALLKPMKPFTASLEDHAWVGPETLDHPVLQPLIRFLDALLAPAPVQP